MTKSEALLIAPALLPMLGLASVGQQVSQLQLLLYLKCNM
jgi:hypothetical protein